MSVNLRDFMNAMNEWIRDAPPEAREVLPASMWMKVRQSSTDVDGGVYFDPRTIVDVALDGRKELLDPVAAPLALALNTRFAPKSVAPRPRRGGLVIGTPSPAAAPATPAAPAAEERGHSFPAYDYSRDDLDSVEKNGPHVPVNVERVNGRLHYSWPDLGNGELYRVVVSDLEDPYSPDEFEEIAVTEGTEAWDSAPATTAVRFVTVWAYERSSGGSLGQCRRVASRVIVQDLRDWTLEFDSESRTVIGSWTPPEAPNKAQVAVRSARLPVDQPPDHFLETLSWMDPNFEMPNSGSGFRDARVEGGKRYNYVTAVEVSLNGRTYASNPVLRSITPTIVLERIKDLDVVEVPASDPSRSSSLTLTWTQSPQTTVVLYRTREPVDERARSNDEILQSQLADARLPEEARLNSRLVAIDECANSDRVLHTLADIPWPDDTEWDTLYLTPVTLHSGDRATIGRPRCLKRARQVRHATLTRRLSWDLVTFTWPGDAAAVELRYTAAGQELDCRQLPWFSVTKEKYRDDGGCVLERERERGLPAAGGRLHLNSLTYLEGRRIPSPVVSLDVPPRWVYRYTLIWPGDAAPMRCLARLAASIRKQTFVEVRVTPEQGFTDPDDGVDLMLLHHSSRLPLSPSDSRPVPLYRQRPAKKGDQSGSPVVPLPPHGQNLSLWFDCSELTGGYLRLAVNSTVSSQIDQEYSRRALEHYALIDPELSELSVLHRRR